MRRERKSPIKMEITCGDLWKIQMRDNLNWAVVKKYEKVDKRRDDTGVKPVFTGEYGWCVHSWHMTPGSAAAAIVADCSDEEFRGDMVEFRQWFNDRIRRLEESIVAEFKAIAHG